MDTFIYKLVCKDTKLCYIGSTTMSLIDRLRHHEAAFRGWKKRSDLYPYYTSYIILDRGNYEICELEFIQDCDNNTRYEREKWFITNFPQVINKNVPNRDMKEYYKTFCTQIKEQMRTKYHQDINGYKTRAYERYHTKRQRHIENYLTYLTITELEA